MGMRGVIIATASLLILASVSAARSEIIALDVEPRGQLKMEVPPDFCPLRAGPRQAETELLATIQGTTQGTAKLLAYLMPCEDYKNLGTDQFSGSIWITIIAPIVDGRAAKFPGYSRERFLQEVAKTSAKKANGGLSDTERAALDRAAKEFGIDITPVKSLGVLDRDDNGVYTGGLERVASGSSSEIVAGVFAATFASGYYISLNTYGIYDNPQDFDDMLDVTKELAEVFVDVN
jgi:hypothetical protein